IRLTEDARKALSRVLIDRHRKAFDARTGVEATWKKGMLNYQGCPTDNEPRQFPFENAPNIHISIGALATDAIGAQATDLVFSPASPVTVRSRKGQDDFAEAAQDYLDWGIRKRFHFRESTKEMIPDWVGLGDGCLYIPWTRSVLKTNRSTNINEGPQIYADRKSTRL